MSACERKSFHIKIWEEFPNVGTTDVRYLNVYKTLKVSGLLKSLLYLGIKNSFVCKQSVSTIGSEQFTMCVSPVLFHNYKMPLVLLCATFIFLVNVIQLNGPEVGRH